MKAPPIPALSNGATYCEGPDGRTVCNGSQMGRRNVLPESLEDRQQPCKLRLVRLRMVDFGCYDDAGAYWGMGTPLYRAIGDCGEVRAEVFTRAKSREEAKANVRIKLPGARFWR